MKRIIVSMFMLVGLTAFAQSGSGFGIKGGLNFGSNGDLSIVENAQEIGSDTKTGFHLGAFAKFSGGGSFYLRPELIYTSTKSEYEGQDDLEIQKLDLPVLLGLNLIGPLHAFAGPSFQYILDSKFEFDGQQIDDIENDFSIGLQFGVGVNLGEELGVDLRYERGLSENEASFVGIEERIDTRPSQLILGLSYKF